MAQVYRPDPSTQGEALFAKKRRTEQPCGGCSKARP